MSCSDGECYSCLPQSFLVSLLSLVSTLVFSQTGGVLSQLNSLTLRFPRFSPRNLCYLVTLAVFSFIYAATDTAFCLALIFLGLAESRTIMQRLWTPVPGHLSSHSALSSYGLFAPLTLWRLYVFIRPLVHCTNQQPPQRGGAVPGPVWVGSKWLLASPRGPVTPDTLHSFFAMLPPERPQKGSTQHL